MSEQFGFSQEVVSLISKLYEDLNLMPAELGMLLARAQKAHLDPLSGQIVPQIRKSKDGDRWVRKLTLVTSIDALRLIADRTKCYAPGRATEFGAPGPKYKDAPEWAVVYVRKYAGDAWHEYSGQAFFAEYVQTKRDGGVSPMWERMPHNQLSKCAEALALRRGFPNELSGLYAVEELQHAETPTRPKKTREEVAHTAADLPTREEKLAYASTLKRYKGVVDSANLHVYLKNFMGVGDLTDATRDQWARALEFLACLDREGTLVQKVNANG